MNCSLQALTLARPIYFFMLVFQVKMKMFLYIFNKMVSVAALPGVPIKFKIQASVKTELMKFNVMGS